MPSLNVRMKNKCQTSKCPKQLMINKRAGLICSNAWTVIRIDTEQTSRTHHNNKMAFGTYSHEKHLKTVKQIKSQETCTTQPLLARKKILLWPYTTIPHLANRILWGHVNGLDVERVQISVSAVQLLKPVRRIKHWIIGILSYMFCRIPGHHVEPTKLTQPYTGDSNPTTAKPGRTMFRQERATQ